MTQTFINHPMATYHIEVINTTEQTSTTQQDTTEAKDFFANLVLGGSHE